MKKADKEIKEILKKLDIDNGKHSITQSFTNLVFLEVYLIEFLLLGNKKSKSKFDNLIKQYSSSEQYQIMQLLIQLTELYNKQHEPIDIMGKIYNQLSFSRKDLGQVFTPTHISDFMAKAVDEKNSIKNEIEKQGYTVLIEPTCGAGGLILSYAREVQNQGFSISRNLMIIANDIDILCTYMTYIQLVLYDIPAEVSCGDASTDEKKMVLYTPAYYTFIKLLESEKLNIPFCNCCNKKIEGKIYHSEIIKFMQLCEQCYTTEQIFLLLKDLTNGN